MARNSSRQGGAESWKYGVLSHKLREVTLFNFQGGADNPGPPVTKRLYLEGLSPNLTVTVAVGLVMSSTRSLPPSVALPGNTKFTPFTKNTNGGFIYQNPLNLSPQVLPATVTLGPGMRVGGDGSHQEYGTNGADGLLIETTIDPAEYSSVVITELMLCQCAVTAHYTGNWWDIDTIMDLFGGLKINTVDPTLIEVSEG